MNNTVNKNETSDMRSKGSSGKVLNKTRAISLKNKLIAGFSALILLVTFNLIFNLVKMGTIKQRTNSIVEVYQPFVIEILNFSGNLNLATTYLSNYLLTGQRRHKKEYRSLENELHQKFDHLWLALDAGKADISEEKVTDLSAQLNLFYSYANRMIELREDEAKNFKATGLAEETLNPAALGFLGLSSELIDRISDDPPSDSQKRMLLLTSELRHTWLMVITSFRLFLNSNSDTHLSNLELFKEQNKHIISKIKDINYDFQFDELDDLEEYRQTWIDNSYAVFHMIETSSGREDIDLMRTEVFPVVQKIRGILFGISEDQVSASRKDGDGLVHNLELMRDYSGLVIFLTFVLCIILALILIRSFVPPIKRLVWAAQRVSAGELDTNLNVIRNDELGELTLSFNSMVTGLREAEEQKVHYLKELEILNRQLEARVEAKIGELETTQTQLLQSEKLASIGQLAAGVAHEINNPVGYITSNVSTLQQYISDLFLVLEEYEKAEQKYNNEDLWKEVNAAKQDVDINYLKEDIVDLINESQEGVTRVKQIVQDLKDFSHVDEAEWQWVNLHKGIDSTLNVAHNEIKYKAEVRKEYGDIPDIECMPSQINQVLMNLIVNAAHAIEEKGVITISSGVDGDFVWVSVSDTGKGMPDDVQQKIFDPFFTTKAVGKGTGLGLSLSYGIIEKHEGTISVGSEVGKGTTFTIRLPIKQNDDESADTE